MELFIFVEKRILVLSPHIGTDEDQVVFEFFDEGLCTRRKHRVDSPYFVAHFPASLKDHFGKQFFLRHKILQWYEAKVSILALATNF